MMQAGFGWIDFSEEHRDRVFSVVDLLSAEGSVDELGIGVIRDAIADWLFPGVSTIQTRPKYFIIIPQILLSYLKKFHNKEKLPILKDYVHEQEKRIMHQLSKNYNYAEGNGIIGVNVSRNNGELARYPTSVYWNGLRKHGIINTKLSFSEYLRHNELSTYSHGGNKNENANDEMAAFNETFGIKCPLFGAIDEHSKMDLTEEEASYLKDQFLSTNGLEKQEGNLFSQILKSPERIELMITANNFRTLAENLLEDEFLNLETKKILAIALDFDFLIYGAHIRYNIQLHKKAGNMAKEFGKYWEQWLEKVSDLRTEIEQLDFQFIFSTLATRTGASTQRFMHEWKKGILEAAIDTDYLDHLVKKQEIDKKGAKAKLTSTKGEYAEWVGLQGLQYRFTQAQRIIKDITTAYVKP
ncbi:DUF6361 family protein [Chryseobacterium shandongense]|uniref:DUF6361 family protein n=1 Tax=Chryseobacterium shandongense TaxID=1493872 RepID=UPI000F4FDD3C|nr:DUF6361 family protein [Chryseobacterium shandongense]